MANSSSFAVQYRYPGTVNDEPVGMVYALNVNRISPTIWSYTKHVNMATQFATREEAEAAARQHRWPEAKAVEVNG